MKWINLLNKLTQLVGALLFMATLYNPSKINLLFTLTYFNFLAIHILDDKITELGIKK